MRRNSFLVSIILLVSAIAGISGCVISPRRFVGQVSPTPTPTATPTPTGSPSPTPSPTPTPAAQPGKLYVTNQDGNSILRFDNALTASGNQTPAAIITGANTTLSAPQFMAMDTTSDRIYVANPNAGSVLVFDGVSKLSGTVNMAPTRNIVGPNTQLVSPSSVALDTQRDLLYVADATDIVVFSPASTASGNQAFARDITVNATGFIFNAQQVFIDSANDRLYATDANNNAVVVYDGASTLPTATIAPTRTIVGNLTKLAAPSGIALDGAGNLIITNPGNGTITVYSNAATVNGNQAPAAVVGGAATTLTGPAQIIKSTATGSNEFFVADFTSNEVAVFNSLGSLTGTVAPPPGRTISAPTVFTGATTARGVALDPNR